MQVFSATHPLVELGDHFKGPEFPTLQVCMTIELLDALLSIDSSVLHSLHLIVEVMEGH